MKILSILEVDKNIAARLLWRECFVHLGTIENKPNSSDAARPSFSYSIGQYEYDECPNCQNKAIRYLEQKSNIIGYCKSCQQELDIG